MRRSALERRRDSKRKAPEKVELTIRGLMALLVDGNRPAEDRQVNPTQEAFIGDDTRAPAEGAAYMGRAGAAKTSTLCAGAWLRVLFEPGHKAVICRRDYNDLKETTYKRMENMLALLPPGTRIGREKAPPERWFIQPICEDPDDDRVSEITFMGLSDDIGSYEYNSAWVDEADEVEDKYLQQMRMRLRYIRPGTTRDENSYAFRLAFNPPNKGHTLYTACTGRDVQERQVSTPWLRMYQPTMGENERNLPEGYYESLAATMPPDLYQRLVKGEWVDVFPGQPVYREFARHLHVKRVVPWLEDAPLLRFWDFGYRHPYLCWAQLDFHGRLRIVRELLGESIEIGPFIAQVRGKEAEWFPGAKRFIDIGDPAARQKKDTGSTLTELHKKGIKLLFKVNATIESGIRSVRSVLGRLTEKEPALQLSEAGCPILIQALSGGYHLKETGAGAGVEPEKDGYYDHPADAFRYGVHYLETGGSLIETMMTGTDSMPDNVSYDPSQDTF